ncbi:MAG TPA: hypothetical protein VHO69_03465 [Phototrophicaceae bacterium]|nr:hypothetical protein [Phototrophicaceae bacterium]
MTHTKPDLEAAFAAAYATYAAGFPQPHRQYQFAHPRKWKFDFAWPESRIAVEIDGGTWIHGGHSRGAGQSKDAEKRNTAALLGWTVFSFTTDMLRLHMEDCIGLVTTTLDARHKTSRLLRALIGFIPRRWVQGELW